MGGNESRQMVVARSNRSRIVVVNTALAWRNSAARCMEFIRFTCPSVTSADFTRRLSSTDMFLLTALAE